MQGRWRKRPAPSEDAGSAALDPDHKTRRVSSDVRPQPGKKLLKLTFPHELKLFPVHSALLTVPTDDDGDAAVVRRPAASQRDADDGGVALELCVDCSRCSNVRNCGEQVWGASLLLAEYLWCVRHVLTGATVLELGAGLAIPSVCISAFCRRVLVSDCNKVSASTAPPFCYVPFLLTLSRWRCSARTACGRSPAAAATAPSCSWTGDSPWPRCPYSRQKPQPPRLICPASTCSSRPTSLMNPLSRACSSWHCARCSLPPHPTPSPSSRSSAESISAQFYATRWLSTPTSSPT